MGRGCSRGFFTFPLSIEICGVDVGTKESLQVTWVIMAEEQEEVDKQVLTCVVGSFMCMFYRGNIYFIKFYFG